MVGNDNVSRILPVGIDARCNAMRFDPMRRGVIPVPGACAKGEGGRKSVQCEDKRGKSGKETNAEVYVSGATLISGCQSSKRQSKIENDALRGTEKSGPHGLRAL